MNKRLIGVIEDLLGLPAFLGLAALLWWQQKQVHLLAPSFFLAVDRALALPGIPPLAVYAGIGASFAITVSLLHCDARLLTGPLRWRGLVLPLLLAVIWFWLKKG
ncbi:MAG: hypothetical protein CVV27_10735 [Candidatus Melainabacteria bacterium HGW-Melainabacteria-1]|nr:MAG: hypothetical protein CVV27_10735 [Candidatus Melainabacteria bacterium HGW-Melainabacteria-1]